MPQLLEKQMYCACDGAVQVTPDGVEYHSKMEADHLKKGTLHIGR